MGIANRARDGRVRVLVVDDSAYLRKVISRMLSTHPQILVVGIASDGDEALEAVAELNPDVITLDLEMPRCNGLQFLQRMGRESLIPVIVVSSIAADGEPVMSAMEAGAFDFLQKPTALANERLLAMSDELVQKVLAAAQTSPGQRQRLYTPVSTVSLPVPHADAARGAVEVVVIGASTGGPMALRQLLAALPATFPVPVLIVQHMPDGYTAAYAERLNNMVPLQVLEASPGLSLRPGLIVLARGGLHLRVDMARRVQLEVTPLGLPHRPAVDVLFSSVAQVYGSRVLAVVMTGMGRDGTEGAQSIKTAGGRVLAQSEETCVVYGMPRAVVEAGLADKVVGLDDLAHEISLLV